MADFKINMLLAVVSLVAFVPAITAAQDTDGESDSVRDIAVVQRPAAELTPDQESALHVKAWVDRASHIYHPGDEIRLSVRTNEDAYVTILDIGTSGSATVIFPNRRARDNRIQGGRTTTLPAPDASWRLRMMGPQGEEVLKVFASESPNPIFREDDTDSADIYRSFHGGSGGAARDIAVVLNNSHARRWAEVTKVVRISDEDDNGSFGDHRMSLNGGTQSAALNILANLPYRSGFGLMIEPDSRHGVYSRGDHAHFAVTADRDCNLKLVDVGTSGDVTVLFPNRLQHNTHIRAHETVFIPGRDSGVAYKIRGPEGEGQIVAVCRADDESFLEEPWNWSSDDFQTYGGGREAFARDIVVVANHNDHGHIAYDAADYRVVP